MIWLNKDYQRCSVAYESMEIKQEQRLADGAACSQCHADK
jgi:hypothetical protein